MKILDRLKKLGACPPALDEYSTDNSTPQEGWDACQRGDYLLWLVAKAHGSLPPESPERRALGMACVECAALAPRSTDPRVEVALVVTWQWCAGDPYVTLDDVRRARASASAAASAASASASAAAYAAASASASAAAYAAYADAADAADAAYAASADAADAAARSSTLARCAEIVRLHFPSPPEVLL